MRTAQAWSLVVSPVCLWCLSFVPMARSESGGSRFLLCFGLFVVVSCSFCDCANLMRLKALHKFQGQTEGSLLHHGRLLIGQSSLQGATPKRTEAAEAVLDVDSDYQADMAWEEPKQPTVWGNDYSRLNPGSRAVEQLLKLEPEVECTRHSMSLQVRNTASTPGSLFFVDRGSHLSPLPLSKLPPSCGFTFRPSQGHFVLVAPYDGCFVALEEDSYVLPLRWLGLAVRMSCPLMRQSTKPPMVTCHTEGMIVKTEWTVSVDKINVKLNGSWEPLMKASSSCGFSVVVHPKGVVISVHYAPCLEEKDGMYTLDLTGDGESKISCPSLSASHPEATENSHPQPEDHHQHSNPQVSVPQVPGSPQFPGTSVEPHDVVAPAVIPNPQAPYYPFPFYVPLPQHSALPTQPPVTEPPVKHPAVQPADQEPHPSSPFVFYNHPLVDQAYLNEPHREHFFHQDPYHHRFLDSGHYPMPLKQETTALSPQSQSLPHLEAPQAPSALQQVEQVTTPSSNGNDPQSVMQQHSSGGVVPPDSAWLSSVHCPQVCPSEFPNCCPQMAFYQYLHLVPTGFGSKPTGFGSSLGSAHHHQNPAEPLAAQAHSSSTSTPISPQSNAPGNGHEHLQPADGVHAAQAGGHLNEPNNPELPDNAYNLPHVGPFYPVLYNVPSKPWAQGSNAFNQMLQFEPYNLHIPKHPNGQQWPRNVHNPTGLHLTYMFGQQQQRNKPAVWQPQPSHSLSRESPDLDLVHVPESTIQEAQAPTYKTALVPNFPQTQPLVYMAHDQTVHSSEPKRNVLPHHGPPGWKSNTWSDPQLPFKKLVHEPNFVAQNLGQRFPWEQYQRVSWDR